MLKAAAVLDADGSASICLIDTLCISLWLGASNSYIIRLHSSIISSHRLQLCNADRQIYFSFTSDLCTRTVASKGLLHMFSGLNWDHLGDIRSREYF